MLTFDWTEKPPLGTSLRTDSPWYDGLIGAWAFNEQGGKSIVNAVTGVQSTLQNGTFAWNGGILVANGTTALNLNTLAPTGALTIVLQSAFLSAAYDRPVFLAAGASYPHIRVRTNETGTGNVMVFLGSSCYQYFSAPIGSFSNINNVFTFTIPGTANGDAILSKCYLNGVALPLGAGSSGAQAARGTLSLGSTGIGYTGSRFANLSIFNRVLSAQEVAGLSPNVWQLWEPERQWLSSIIGAGGTQLDILNAIHAQTSGSLNLSQLHQLGILGANHSQLAGPSTLTQVHAVSVASGLHNHTADSLTLSQNHVLTTLNSNHSSTATNLILTQNHILAVNNTLQGHSAGSVPFEQALELIVQGATHGLVSSQLALSQLHQLIVQAASHGHQVNNSVISQAHSLITNNSNHSQLSGNPNITLNLLLDVYSSSHSQAVSSLTLSQNHLATIQSAVHATVSANSSLNQDHTLIVSNTLHAQVARLAGIIQGIISTPDSRILMVKANNRIYVISKEERSFNIKG